MRAVLQRVSQARVRIGDEVTGEIENGLVVLLGIEGSDTSEDILWLVRKLVNMRIFEDDAGKMNKAIDEVGGGMLVISQFTLFASTKKGNRPSFIRAAHPDQAIPLYDAFLETLSAYFSGSIQTGRFGAMMDVELVNQGPVTIVIDTKNKE